MLSNMGQTVESDYLFSNVLTTTNSKPLKYINMQSGMFIDGSRNYHNTQYGSTYHVVLQGS